MSRDTQVQGARSTEPIELARTPLPVRILHDTGAVLHNLQARLSEPCIRGALKNARQAFNFWISCRLTSDEPDDLRNDPEGVLGFSCPSQCFTAGAADVRLHAGVT